MAGPRRRTLLRVSAFLMGIAAGAGHAPALTLEGRVTRVIDGDTIRVESRGFETPVRLIGIDAPETRIPGEPVRCGGPEATARLRAVLPVGAPVRLVSDPTQDVRDRFARLLAYVYQGGRTGAASVNHGMVATGHARVYVFEPSGPFRFAARFREAERAARGARRGIWGPPCNGDTTRPAPRSARPAAGRCDPAYRGACVPPYPPDVNCAQVAGPVTVVGPDPHRLDGDGDGTACASERRRPG
jgi:micrococcal nuclease